jgi:endonuclease G, mitochondrial
MKVTRDDIARVEQRLAFDPRALQRALLDRTPIASAPPETVRRRLAHALSEGLDASELAVDRVLTGADGLTVSYLERGMIASDAVARVEVHDDEAKLVGFGTGFMISPRLFLTTNLVLPSAERASHSWLEFRYEFDALGRAIEPVTFAFDPVSFFFTDPDLDFTVVAIAEQSADRAVNVASFGWLRLNPDGDTALPGEWLTLVHHPGGKPKQVALRQNLLVDVTDSELWYVTDTAPGSSGAPVFNDSWQVVALHGLGAPARGVSGEILTCDGAPFSDETDDGAVVWRASLGASTYAVLRRLAAACGEHPWVEALLRDGRVDASDALVIPLGSGAQAQPTPHPGSAPAGHNGAHAPHAPRTASGTSDNGDAITVTVPLRITVHPANGGGRVPAVGVDLS